MGVPFSPSNFIVLRDPIIKYANVCPSAKGTLISKDTFFKLLNTKNNIETSQNKWQKYRSILNPLENVIKISKKKRLSRAYFKLNEIIYRLLELYPILKDNWSRKELRTLHLCEAPGGFIEYFQEYRRKNWIKHKWWGQSLNVNLLGDHVTFSNKIKNDSTGTIITDLGDRTGDLTKRVNVKDIVTKIKGIHLTTCDGGFDVSGSFVQQEQQCLPLIFNQIITSIGASKKGSILIIKFFDTFTYSSAQCITFLYFAYDNIYLLKPEMSRAGNSEKYFVCIGLKDWVKETNIIDDIISNIKSEKYIEDISFSPSDVWTQSMYNVYRYMNKINEQLSTNQYLYIEKTIKLYDQEDTEIINRIKEDNLEYSKKYCKRYNLN